MSDETKLEKSKKDDPKTGNSEGATLPGGTQLPPISDEKWKKFENELPRNSRDKKSG